MIDLGKEDISIILPTQGYSNPKMILEPRGN